MGDNSTKMKVLHIILSLKAGGAEKLIEQSLPIMKNDYDLEVEVLIFTDSKKVFSKGLEDNNIPIIVSPYNNIRSIKNLFFVLQHIKKNKYDIIHSHLFPCNYILSIVSLFIYKNKPKLITTEHNTHNRRRDKFYFRPIEKLIYSKYDTIISISESAQENLITWLGVKKNKSKFVKIDNGINIQDFKNAHPYSKHELDSRYEEKTKLICMVGSFSKQKDQATIIRAMQYLPEDVHLLLVGDGPRKQEHQRLARELQVEERIKFLGIRTDVSRILKTVDIAIISSNWEGFGLVALEGMAAGKPVIASDVPGLAEVVENAGVLFTKGDEKGLSDIITNLFNNNDEYNIVKKKCKKRAEKYSIDRMVEKHINTYNSCL